MAEKHTNDPEACGAENPDAQISSETDRVKKPVAPVKEKIGEGRGNLHQRSEWYQRRSGGSR